MENQKLLKQIEKKIVINVHLKILHKVLSKFLRQEISLHSNFLLFKII